MSEQDYREGVDFIKKTSGTPAEAQYRLAEWERLAKPLVGKQLCTGNL